MMKKRFACFSYFTLLIVLIMIYPCFSFSVSADSNSISISGQRYEFGEKDGYKIPGNAGSKCDSSMGQLSINGELTSNGTHSSKVKKDFPAYKVADGQLFTINYNYSDALLKADEKSWHLYADNGKKVDDVELDSAIKNGAIILQTSLDGFKWVTSSTKTNLVQSSGSYTFQNDINDIQLVNGCFYRVIVAYELQIDAGPTGVKFIVWDVGTKYEYKKIADVYEFYASYDLSDEVVSGEKYNFYVGAQSDYTYRTKKNDYAGRETIDNKDPHFGWNLGSFCLSGYTDKGDSDDVYFKTVGNKIKLNFTLNENIKKLHGNDKLTIVEDTNGSDTGFSVSPHNMGHGELIVKHTNSEGQVKITPYSNYLEALAYPSADTTIKLSEEGDYEVHLDYAIKNAGNFGKITYYQTSFSFKIRNGNCMVYIFDTNTGRELQNGDNTSNGFYVDSAKSGYPKLTVKKEIPNGDKNDTSFNRAVSDGEKFTDKGIYTITASNRYNSNMNTEKTIYVGINTKDVSLEIYEIGGDKLYDGDSTSKGFYIDLVGSGLPDIKVKKQVYKDSSGNLKEEYSGRSVKSGDKFTEDGVYTVTATNRYNKNIQTDKIINIGTGLNLKLIDAQNGGEIKDGSTVVGGFYVDNASSGYPQLKIKREVVNSEHDGLEPNMTKTPDEEERFTDSGLYTISATNRYNNDIKAEIKVCVGNDPVLAEYIKDPEHSDIGEIYTRLNEATTTVTTEEITETTSEMITTASDIATETTISTVSITEVSDIEITTPEEPTEKKGSALPFVFGGIGVAAGGGAFYFLKKKKGSGGDTK